MSRSSASISLDAQRSVAAPIGAVRAELERCLRVAGFSITGEQATSLAATRGSALGALQHDRLPMRAVVRFSPDDSGCRVAVRLEERTVGPTRFLGVHGAYQSAFAELLASLDAALARVDPAVVLVASTLNSAEAPVAAMEQVGGAASRAGRQVLSRANRFLEGRGKSVPVAWRGVEEVVLTSSEGHAVVELEVVRAMLVVANLVSEHPGSLPPKLTREVDGFSARLEQSLESAGGADRAYFAVADPELPVVKFLATQANIRQRLPLRTLHVCTTCRLEKITNPDYERLQARNRRLRNITGGLGATVSKSGVSPFVVVGQLMKLKKLDPDYVCTRCQSLDADTMVVTFCPNCGERRSEAVLRTCQKCSHDFRKAVTGEFWHEGPPPLAAPALPAAPVFPLAPAPSLAPPPVPTAIPAPAEIPALVRGMSPIPSPPALAGTAQAKAQPPAWHPDPSGRWPLRWWDGAGWTEHVANDGSQGVDPI
jgi:hypothetical protein